MSELPEGTTVEALVNEYESSGMHAFLYYDLLMLYAEREEPATFIFKIPPHHRRGFLDYLTHSFVPADKRLPDKPSFRAPSDVIVAAIRRAIANAPNFLPQGES